jgi:hypothetical protein
MGSPSFDGPHSSLATDNEVNRGLLLTVEHRQGDDGLCRCSEAHSRGVLDGLPPGKLPAYGLPSLALSRHLLVPVYAFKCVGIIYHKLEFLSIALMIIPLMGWRI